MAIQLHLQLVQPNVTICKTFFKIPKVLSKYAVIQNLNTKKKNKEQHLWALILMQNFQN